MSMEALTGYMLQPQFWETKFISHCKLICANFSFAQMCTKGTGSTVEKKREDDRSCVLFYFSCNRTYLQHEGVSRRHRKNAVCGWDPITVPWAAPLCRHSDANIIRCSWSHETAGPPWGRSSGILLLSCIHLDLGKEQQQQHRVHRHHGLILSKTLSRDRQVWDPGEI